jgi:putative peptidoglycan lipid II flippase
MAVWQSVAGVTFFSVLQILVQFALQMLLAARFGTSPAIDALQATLAIPQAIQLLLTLPLGFALVPLLTRAFQKDANDPEAWQMIATVGGMLVATALTATMVLYIGRSFWIDFFLPGLDSMRHQLASDQLIWLSWQVLWGSMVTFLSTIYQAQQRFLYPAWIAFAFSLLHALWTWRWATGGIEAYTLSMFLTGLGWVTALIWPLRRALQREPFGINPMARDLWRMALPLLLGNAVMRWDMVVERWLLSFLPPGTIAHFGYTQRFVTALSSISVGGLLTVLFARLNRGEQDEGADAVRHRQMQGIYALLWILIPIVVGISFFAESVTGDLLQRGAFSATDTAAVGSLFRVLVWTLLGASLADWTARGFFAIGNTMTPTWIGLVAMLLGWAAKAILVRLLGSEGLAIGSVVHLTLTALAIGIVLSWRIGPLWDRPLTHDTLRLATSALATCFLCLPLVAALPQGGSLAVAPLGAGLYLTFLYLQNDRLARLLIAQLTERFRS